MEIVQMPVSVPHTTRSSSPSSFLPSVVASASSTTASPDSSPVVCCLSCNAAPCSCSRVEDDRLRTLRTHSAVPDHTHDHVAPVEACDTRAHSAPIGVTVPTDLCSPRLPDLDSPRALAKLKLKRVAIPGAATTPTAADASAAAPAEGVRSLTVAVPDASAPVVPPAPSSKRRAGLTVTLMSSDDSMLPSSSSTASSGHVPTGRKPLTLLPPQTPIVGLSSYAGPAAGTPNAAAQPHRPATDGFILSPTLSPRRANATLRHAALTPSSLAKPVMLSEPTPHAPKEDSVRTAAAVSEPAPAPAVVATVPFIAPSPRAASSPRVAARKLTPKAGNAAASLLQVASMNATVQVHGQDAIALPAAAATVPAVDTTSATPTTSQPSTGKSVKRGTFSFDDDDIEASDAAQGTAVVPAAVTAPGVAVVVPPISSTSSQPTTGSKSVKRGAFTFDDDDIEASDIAHGMATPPLTGAAGGNGGPSSTTASSSSAAPAVSIVQTPKSARRAKPALSLPTTGGTGDTGHTSTTSSASDSSVAQPVAAASAPAPAAEVAASVPEPLPAFVRPAVSTSFPAGPSLPPQSTFVFSPYPTGLHFDVDTDLQDILPMVRPASRDEPSRHTADAFDVSSASSRRQRPVSPKVKPSSGRRSASPEFAAKDSPRSSKDRRRHRSSDGSSKRSRRRSRLPEHLRHMELPRVSSSMLDAMLRSGRESWREYRDSVRTVRGECEYMGVIAEDRNEESRLAVMSRYTTSSSKHRQRRGSIPSDVRARVGAIAGGKPVAIATEVSSAVLDEVEEGKPVTPALAQIPVDDWFRQCDGGAWKRSPQAAFFSAPLESSPIVLSTTAKPSKKSPPTLVVDVKKPAALGKEAPFPLASPVAVAAPVAKPPASGTPRKAKPLSVAVGAEVDAAAAKGGLDLSLLASPVAAPTSKFAALSRSSSGTGTANASPLTGTPTGAGTPSTPLSGSGLVKSDITASASSLPRSLKESSSGQLSVATSGSTGRRSSPELLELSRSSGDSGPGRRSSKSSSRRHKHSKKSSKRRHSSDRKHAKRSSSRHKHRRSRSRRSYSSSSSASSSSSYSSSGDDSSDFSGEFDDELIELTYSDDEQLYSDRTDSPHSGSNFASDSDDDSRSSSASSSDSGRRRSSRRSSRRHKHSSRSSTKRDRHRSSKSSHRRSSRGSRDQDSGAAATAADSYMPPILDTVAFLARKKFR